MVPGGLERGVLARVIPILVFGSVFAFPRSLLGWLNGQPLNLRIACSWVLDGKGWGEGQQHMFARFDAINLLSLWATGCA